MTRSIRLSLPLLLRPRLRPSRAEGCAALAAGARGIPGLPPLTLREARPCGPPQKGRVIPLPGRRPSTCYPRSRRRAEVQQQLHLSWKDGTMALPKFIEIDGKRIAWRDLLQQQQHDGG
jgi:hypothetical protein